ncbi:NUDIX domain-containing protein [Erythrobacter sp. GH3-10]|uniref:8-oxo-dGTP diphosphatase n=2 Tax=Aurantiacibacter rhizosphaerae TaxID=2691582 RepID=A0A844XEB2_9SPHN|nr:(deoxy)nucleoside triphosphate pyrophosphohydrolase [Aurantiacibacter rhizosphaerae]MWV27815.1 NUDIX domain-containing protein [Aurantiacibacter rhizosphaerae]
MLVVALALFDKSGRILLQQRLPGKHHGGLWEFPGGKVESDETPRVALVREIEEELGLHLEPGSLTPAFFAEEPGDRAVVLNLYTASFEGGELVGRDGQAWGWFAHEDAANLPLAPMDRQLLAFLHR